MLRVKSGHLQELHADETDGSLSLVFTIESVELHPGHFLKACPGGIAITIYNSDRVVLCEDATPADIAEAAAARQ